jgi:hypothetical protein
MLMQWDHLHHPSGCTIGPPTDHQFETSEGVSCH